MRARVSRPGGWIKNGDFIDVTKRRAILTEDHSNDQINDMYGLRQRFHHAYRTSARVHTHRHTHTHTDEHTHRHTHTHTTELGSAFSCFKVQCID